MDTVYNNTIYNIAMALNADPSNFTSLNAISYLDSMWSYYFNQQPITTLDEYTLNSSMYLFGEYYNFSFSMNDTVRKVFLTGLLGEIVDNF